MLKVGYDNGNDIDMFVEHFGYDIMELAEAERSEEQNNNRIDSSDDDYYSGDDCEEIENVNFQTEKIPRTIEEILSIRSKRGGLLYPTFDVDIPWGRMEPTLGMRNVEGGRCAGKKDNKDMVMPNKVRTGVEKAVKKKVVKKKVVSESGEGSLVTYKWIALQYCKEIIEDPFMPLRKIRVDIRQKFMIDVSLGQCRRAKQLALFDQEGGLIEHYRKLYQYRQALLDSNPGSTCRLNVDEYANGSATFKRMYICFKRVKDGWLAGCRKVICWDRCFLKHTCWRELLTAMGRDANNQMYPIAWAVVRVENADNLGWFLHLLHDNPCLNDGNGITIVSDSHKGLIDVGNDWLSEAEHRKCTRNIYANFKKSAVDYNIKDFSGLQPLVDGAVAQNTNNTTVRSIILAEKLTGSNFTNWYRNLRIVLRYELKIRFVEQPIRPDPDPETADPNTIDKYYEYVNLEQEVEDGQSVSSYLLKMKSYLDTLERLGYAMPKEVGTLAELHAMLKLHEKVISNKAETPTVLAICEGKIQKDKKKLQWEKGKAKGKNKLTYAPKTKNPPSPKRDNPTKDSICHYCKERLRRGWKLKHGALSLYMGNRMRAAVEAIERFDLILPSGLIIVFDNCYFRPTVTRGVVSNFSFG
nr:hypothetical protein CTI12_AA105810 [Tanacetum cinerariifolium]